jgi:hypothetical protein
MRPHRVAAPRYPLSGIALLAFAGALAAVMHAGAADWVEKPFDPPPGSRWIIQSEETSEDDNDGRSQTSASKTTSELTFGEKTTDGFVISIVERAASYDGDARRGAVVSAFSKALQDVVIRGTVAADGTPRSVDNLDEVHDAVRAAIDRLTESMADKPQVASITRDLATRVLISDAQRAPQVYLGALLVLARGQNTGLRPGETRSTVEDVPNPLSGTPIKSNNTSRIERADPATGDVRYIRTVSANGDSVKEFLRSLAGRFAGTDKTPQQLDDFLQQFAMTIDSRSEIEVEGGMTRAVHEEDTATVTLRDHTVTKRAHKQLTVAPAP